jgi:hypothetical protein
LHLLLLEKSNIWLDNPYSDYYRLLCFSKQKSRDSSRITRIPRCYQTKISVETSRLTYLGLECKKTEAFAKRKPLWKKNPSCNYIGCIYPKSSNNSEEGRQKSSCIPFVFESFLKGFTTIINSATFA